jgi:hypothetical protein
MQDRLRRLCRRRHKGTFAIGALINRAVAAMPDDQVCLHLGVGGGFPLFAGMADNSGKCCVGVDDLAGRRQSSSARLVARFVHRQGPRDEIHVVDVRKYLMSVHRRPIGVCVCNRPPGYAALLERLQLAEPFFADGAILMLNDANSLPIRQAAFDYVASSPFEYRTLLDVQTPRSGHPTFWNGLMVLARGLPRAGAAFATERAA